MTTQQIAHMYFTENRVIVVLLDGKAGFLHSCPMPESLEALVQVPMEEEIRFIPVVDLAYTEVHAILTQANKWGGQGAWPEYRARMDALSTRAMMPPRIQEVHERTGTDTYDAGESVTD